MRFLVRKNDRLGKRRRWSAIVRPATRRKRAARLRLAPVEVLEVVPGEAAAVRFEGQRAASGRVTDSGSVRQSAGILT